MATGSKIPMYFSVWGGRWNVRKPLKINNIQNPSHIIKEI